MSHIKSESKERVLKRFVSELTWASFVVRRRVKTRLLRLKRSLVQPRLPKNPDGKVLIHLGCGSVNSPEFINVDARPAPHVHYVRDVCDLSIFPNEYADLIYASHILEHIPHAKLYHVLWEWKRVLKYGGVLRLSVPDFDKLLRIYVASSCDINSIYGILLGGQNHEFNIHYSIFNRKFLSDKLKHTGFRNVREWDPQDVDYHAFEDTASRSVKLDGKLYRVSLNLEVVK